MNPKNIFKPGIWILFLILSLIGSGCAWFSEKPEEKSAAELINDGMTAFEKEKYDVALENFEKLKNWYPFSKYASLAELKTADAYYNLENYDEAVFAYESFESLHPRNEAIPYVIFQIGRCYFEQMDSIDRDQTAAQKALSTFTRLQREHPESLYARKAGPLIRECYESLAGHEFYVGLFYFKSKHYKTALNRFQAVISDYPDVGGLHEKARRYIAMSQARIAEKE